MACTSLHPRQPASASSSLDGGRRRHRGLGKGLGLVLALALAGCSSGSADSAPRLTTIPQQQAPGAGTMFALDLSAFASDPEGAALSYAVLDGGGSFAGSTYENTFDTMGTYVVTFAVGDGTTATVGTFVVVVESANLAVVRRDGKSLRLLDTDTEKFVLVSESPATESFAAALGKGQMVYERTTGNGVDLFAYDPASRTAATLGADPARDERFVAIASGVRVVFSVGIAPDRDLHVWNAATGLTKTVSAIAGQDERNASVDGQGLVFYERAPGGKGDVLYYDPSVDQSTTVANDPADEAIESALPGGGVVFTRRGAVAELDLFHFQPVSGVREIGLDVAALDTLDKSFDGVTSDGRVVFSATDGSTVPATVNVYVWNPQTDKTTHVSSTTALEANTFGAVTQDDIVVYTATDTTNGGNDIIAYDVAGGTRATANAGNVTHVFEAVTTRGGESAVVYTIPGGSTTIHVYNIATTTRYDATATSYAFDAILIDGRIAFTEVGGTGGLFVYDHVPSTFQTAVSGLGVPTFRGEGADAGDVVFSLDAGGQDDLFYWDDSATQLVTVSNAAEDDTFQAVNPAGKVLFTRIVAGNTNQDLFVFDLTDTTTERLTQADEIGNLHDHAVLGTYHADSTL